MHAYENVRLVRYTPVRGTSIRSAGVYLTGVNLPYRLQRHNRIVPPADKASNYVSRYKPMWREVLYCTYGDTLTSSGLTKGRA
jgi:hypothetical protein